MTNLARALSFPGGTPTQKLLLVYIADWSGGTGRTYTPLSKYAEAVGLTEKTVKRNVDHMIDNGVLARGVDDEGEYIEIFPSLPKRNDATHKIA